MVVGLGLGGNCGGVRSLRSKEAVVLTYAVGIVELEMLSCFLGE